MIVLPISQVLCQSNFSNNNVKLLYDMIIPIVSSPFLDLSIYLNKFINLSKNKLIFSILEFFKALKTKYFHNNFVFTVSEYQSWGIGHRNRYHTIFWTASLSFCCLGLFYLSWFLLGIENVIISYGIIWTAPNFFLRCFYT